MPAKKRGKGGKKSPKNSAAAKKPAKTPAAPRGGSGSKRRGKDQSLVSSVPRRVSPRLLEKRKMQENGFGKQLVMIAAQGNEHDQSLLKPSRNGKKRVGDEDKSVEGEDHAVAEEGGETGDRENSQEEDNPEQEEEEEEEELDQAVFERGAGAEKELEIVTIDVPDAVKEAEERLENHAVLLYFSRGDITMTRELVKEWIYSVVGDRETIGSIQCCRDLGRGFFLVVFELAEARRAAMAAKPRQSGLQVTVFPWCAATVNEAGEQCSPRMIVLPGLPDQFFMLLPTIARSLGSFIGCVGALDPDANLESARASMPKGWESAYSATPAWAVGTARIAVMMPLEARLPTAIQLQVRSGVSKRQEIYEEGAPASRNPKKRAATGASASAKKRRRS